MNKLSGFRVMDLQVGWPYKLPLFCINTHSLADLRINSMKTV